MLIKKKLTSLKKQDSLTVIGNLGPAGKSAGVSDKPESCGQCKFCEIGVGFLKSQPDYTAPLGFLFSYPTKEEILYNTPYSGGSGYVRKKFTEKRANFKKITNTPMYLTRCMPPFWLTKPSTSHPAYKPAQASCDRVHGGFSKFKPDIVMITYEPMQTMDVGAYTRQLEKDIDKAVYFCENGYRVLVALGDKAAQYVAPFIAGKGGLPAWHGHWWEHE